MARAHEGTSMDKAMNIPKGTPASLIADLFVEDNPPTLSAISFADRAGVFAAVDHGSVSNLTDDLSGLYESLDPKRHE
jgi:hypothetical protein